MLKFGSQKYTTKLFTLFFFCIFAINSLGQSGLTVADKKIAKGVQIKTIKRITENLADDRFEGRGVMQNGGKAAAEWIAGEMKKLGLKPLGDNNSYFQSVPFVETVFTDTTKVAIGGQRLTYGKDWAAAGLFPDLDVKAPLVFVGHGTTSTSRDDLKGYDVKGKVAVMIEGPPTGVTQVDWETQGGLTQGIVGLFQKGAVGIILIANGREPHPRDLMIDFSSRRIISTPEGAKQVTPIPLVYIASDRSQDLFAGSQIDAKSSLSQAEEKSFKPVTLDKEIEITFRSRSTEGTSLNVVGYIEGSDPVLKSEAVVFSAHYDAYGLLNGKIYNGAADNAIGNGEMFAVAKAFSKMKKKPKRSLIFISCTAEEAGLLGSKYWANNPTWDITKVTANLNLDGIGTEIMGPVKSMIGFGAKYSTLGAQFDSLTKAYGISVMEDPIPEQGVFKRSDHYSFVERGVPALMLVGSPVTAQSEFKKVFEEFETTKYHQPSDDVYTSWQWNGAKTVADIMAIIGLRLANADDVPSWLPGNEYSNLKRGVKPNANK